MDKDEIELRYSRLRPRYERLLEEVSEILAGIIPEIEEGRIVVTTRVKEFPSFYAKVLRKDVTDPFAHITDIAGARIVCQFMSQMKYVEQKIAENFEVISSDLKIDALPEHQFGYMSDHFVIRLAVNANDPRFSGQRYKDIRKLPCELQVRTIMMDAWAQLSHDLAYKQYFDVPRDLRRDFFALSGLFYVADTHFERFFNNAHANREAIEERAKSGEALEHEDLDGDRLGVFLRQFYPDREVTSVDALSELLHDLLEANVRTVGQLGDALQQGRRLFLEYEQQFPPTLSPQYTADGAVRITLSATNSQYAQLHPPSEERTKRFDAVRRALQAAKQ